MLPKGVLSLHGYNVKHGFFSGTCAGSSFLPFEKSCDLVKEFINSAQSRLANLEQFQAKLCQPVTEGLAWFHTSQANVKGRFYGSTRDWKLCDVREEVGTYSKFFRTGDTRWKQFDKMSAEIVSDETQVSAYVYDATLASVCTGANQTYAKWLEHEADSLRRYIAWQTDRVNTWKVASLLPVTHSDKEGFKPTEARY